MSPSIVSVPNLIHTTRFLPKQFAKSNQFWIDPVGREWKYSRCGVSRTIVSVQPMKQALHMLEENRFDLRGLKYWHAASFGWCIVVQSIQILTSLELMVYRRHLVKVKIYLTSCDRGDITHFTRNQVLHSRIVMLQVPDWMRQRYSLRNRSVQSWCGFFSSFM
jgi:hypothetical protein